MLSSSSEDDESAGTATGPSVSIVGLEMLLVVWDEVALRARAEAGRRVDGGVRVGAVV